MLMVVCQLSRDAIGCEDSKCHLCVSFSLLSQLNSRLLLVKFSVVQSQVCRCQFFLTPSVVVCTMPVTVDYDSVAFVQS